MHPQELSQCRFFILVLRYLYNHKGYSTNQTMRIKKHYLEKFRVTRDSLVKNFKGIDRFSKE